MNKNYLLIMASSLREAVPWLKLVNQGSHQSEVLRGGAGAVWEYMMTYGVPDTLWVFPKAAISGDFYDLLGGIRDRLDTKYGKEWMNPNFTIVLESADIPPRTLSKLNSLMDSLKNHGFENCSIQYLE